MFFGEVEIPLTPKLRGTVGLRADYLGWDVSALRSANSGDGDDAVVTPKLNLAYRFSEDFEGYVNWGRGFHSNDVRGATISVDPVTGDPAGRVDALVDSDGAEVGLRFEQGRNFNATLVAFWLELDSELVFVGDAGFTEANDGSERKGLELNAFWQANNWLAFNGALTTTDAKFKTDQGGGREIPGAVDTTLTVGANAAWDNGISASFKARYLGESPLVEDNSAVADASLLVNAGIAYRRGPLELRVDAFNLLNSDDNDIAYFYASRLPGEPTGGVEDTHFHPLEPRSVRATMTFHW